jgi:hypothetical protein
MTGQGARTLAVVSQHAGRARPRGNQPPLRRRRSLLAQLRRVLSRLRRPSRHRAALAAQPCPADHRARRMARARGRPRAARRVARSRAGRRLRSFTAHPRRTFAGDRHCRQSGILAPAGRRRTARRRASALLRGRRCARRRRPLVGARRPRASAVGRRLCDRESARALARRPRHLSCEPRRAARTVLSGFSSRARIAWPAGRRAHLRADARTAERNVFRAREFGALPRLSHGRGRRLERAR